MSFDKYLRQYAELLHSDQDVFCTISQVDRYEFRYEGFRFSDGNDDLEENMAWSDRLYGRQFAYSVQDLNYPGLISEDAPLRRMSNHFTRHLSHLTTGDHGDDGLTITHGRMHGQGVEPAGIRLSTFLSEFWKIVREKGQGWHVDSSISQLLQMVEPYHISDRMQPQDILVILHRLHVGWLGRTHYGKTAVMNVDFITGSITYA